MPEKKSTETKAAAPKAAEPVTTGPHPNNGLAIAALVVGIIAFVSGWAPFWGFIVGVGAVILGIIALKKGGNKGMSVAGIVGGGIGLLWSLVVTAFFIIALVTVGVTGVTASGVLNEANKALDQYTADNKALIDAKKDFAKGDTAKFGQFEVKVNSVKRDYTPESSYQAASAGNELIVVNVTVKNAASTSESISSYDLKMNEKGVANAASYVTAAPQFDGGDVSPGASVTGNIVYEVTKGETDLKLQYETIAYDLKGSGVQNLVFTLAI